VATRWTRPVSETGSRAEQMAINHETMAMVVEGYIAARVESEIDDFLEKIIAKRG